MNGYWYRDPATGKCRFVPAASYGTVRPTVTVTTSGTGGWTVKS